MNKPSVNVTINNEVVKLLKNEGIPSDLIASTILILCSLESKSFEVLDHLDDYNKEKRMVVLYNLLKHRNLLIENNANLNEPLYKLSNLGTKLVEKIKKCFDEIKQSELFDIKPQAEHKVVEEISKFDSSSWIKDWLSIFPSKSPDGRLLKSHPSSLIAKMNKFLEKYNYDKEIIMAATKEYIRNQELKEEGHRYTRTATYFIYKGTGTTYCSDLADWCEKIKNGDQDNFKQNVQNLLDIV